jgi:hypothetical protein
LISYDSVDSFFSGYQGRTALRPSLILGVDKRQVREPHKTENVAQIGFLKIPGFPRVIGVPPRAYRQSASAAHSVQARTPKARTSALAVRAAHRIFGTTPALGAPPLLI